MKSKNELKERRGTILFILIILSPFIIYGATQVWASYKLLEASKSIKKSILKTKTNNPSANTFHKANWPIFMKPNNTSLYVGGDMKSSIKISQGIEFTVVDSSTIKYQIDFLEDWEKKQTMRGEAKLDFKSLENNHYKIKNNNGIFFPAYRFTGKHKTCELELFISKTENPTSSFAKILLHCPGKTEDYKTIMFYK